MHAAIRSVRIHRFFIIRRLHLGNHSTPVFRRRDRRRAPSWPTFTFVCSIERALEALKLRAAWTTAPDNGWIIIHEERASTPDGDWIRQLSEHLSGSARAAVIAFLVHDSDVFCYWLCADGRLIDEFNSCPDYFGEDDPGNVAGRPEALLKHCRKGTTLEDVRSVLNNKSVTFADDRLMSPVELLNIDAGRAMADFKAFSYFLGQTPPPGRATDPGSKRSMGAIRHGQFVPAR